jgi:hypothetical protein
MTPRQFLNTGLVAISYLLGCGGKAAAAVAGPVGEDEFPRFMLNDIPPPPPQAAELRAANAGLAVA